MFVPHQQNVLCVLVHQPDTAEMPVFARIQLVQVDEIRFALLLRLVLQLGRFCLDKVFAT